MYETFKRAIKLISQAVAMLARLLRYMLSRINMTSRKYIRKEKKANVIVWDARKKNRRLGDKAPTKRGTGQSSF